MAKKEENVLTLKTGVLQEMVSRVKKGAGNDKQFPITQMIAIQLKDNRLTLITTDYDNYFYISEDKIEGKDFYAVVAVEKFSNLIAKITSDTITMKLDDSSLNIKGNGKYVIPIEVDDDGTMVKYPDPVADMVFDPDDTAEINSSTISTILTTLKPALATTDENPHYMAYYMGSKVCATNEFLINVMDLEVFKEAVLVSPRVMDLLGLMKAENITVNFKDDITVFSTQDCTLYSRNWEGVENYSIDAITNYVNMEFTSMCKLSKSVFLQLLDRLALFVTDLDEGSVYLTFTKDGLQVSSKASDGVELIPYVNSENFTDYTCCIDVTLLSKQIKAQKGDTVELWYGSDSVIKLVENNIVQLVALSDDEDDDLAESGEE